MKKRNLLKPICSFVFSAVVSFSTMFGIIGKGYKDSASQASNSESKPLTSQQKLLNSVMTMKAFEVTGGIEIKLASNQKFNISLDVAGDISDFQNIAVKGNVDLDVNGLLIPATLSYFDSTLYFAYKENKFKLETDNLLSFVDMMPDLGLDISLPPELMSLDINTITTLIDGMEEIQTPNGDKLFILELVEDLDLYVKTDDTYTLKGVRTDHINYNGTEIYLDLDLNKVDAQSLDFTSPVDDGSASEYLSFEGALNLFSGLVKSFQGKTNTVEIKVNLDKTEEDSSVSPVLDATLDLSYDLENMNFTLAGAVDEKERHHTFKGGLVDNLLLIDFNDLKISLPKKTVGQLISYLINEIGSGVLQDILNGSSDLLNSIDIAGVLEKVGKVYKGITLESGLLAVTLDTEPLNLEIGTLIPTIKFDKDHLISIELNGIGIKNVLIDVEITLVDYNPANFVAAEYVAFEPALTLIPAILPLIKQEDFRMEFEGKIGDAAGVKEDIEIGGGVQFNIDTLFGYGEVDITDRKDYVHNIKADMKSPENIIFAYNDTMKGKFNSDTLMDLFFTLVDIVLNPDEHMMELLGDIIEMIYAMPIFKILMDKDFGLAACTNILNSMTVDSNSIKANIGLDIIGFDQDMDIELDYYIENEQSFIDGMKIHILDFEGMNVDFALKLKQFDVSLEKTRLNEYDEYLDFSDIKVLLDLGINTSKFNYFHFSSNLELDIPLFKIDPINLDIKVRNDHGNVQVAVEFLKIPTIVLVSDQGGYLELTDRAGSLYYQDETFYLKRVDTVRKVPLVGNKFTVTYSEVMDLDYFLDNVLDVLLGHLLGFNTSIIDQLIGNKDEEKDTESKIIPYEKILKNFEYNSTSETFLFQVDLGAITNMSMLDTIDLTVYSSENELTGLKVELIIHVLLDFGINLSVSLDEADELSETNKLSVMDSWIASVSSQERNAFTKLSEVKK